jgi:hypothetical protein
MGTSTGDTPERVAENRRRLAEAIGFSPDAVVTARQVHGRRVRLVREAVPPGEGDALVTWTPGLLLGVLVADCAPVILADRHARAVAVCHAGWRGLVAGVVEATVDELVRAIDASDLLAWVGPCLGPRDFEVGPEVAVQLDGDHLLGSQGGDRPLFDLPGAIVSRLVGVGLRPENVETTDVSTLRDPRTFSHRRDGPNTGRMLAVVGLCTVERIVSRDHGFECPDGVRTGLSA